MRTVVITLSEQEAFLLQDVVEHVKKLAHPRTDLYVLKKESTTFHEKYNEIARLENYLHGSIKEQIFATKGR